MFRISFPTLRRANAQVTQELDMHGFWNDRLDSVNVWLVPFSMGAYGWQYYGSSGDINIPRVSMARVGDCVMGRPHVSLRDVFRHEWAHAIADTNRALFRSRCFSGVFGGSHERNDACLDWDPNEHVSTYAATNPSEDFAETFMLWIKHSRRMPARFEGAAGIRRKWVFVDKLAMAVGSGDRR